MKCDVEALYSIIRYWYIGIYPSVRIVYVRTEKNEIKKGYTEIHTLLPTLSFSLFFYCYTDPYTM